MIYVCSPLRGDTSEIVTRNMMRARTWVAQVAKEKGEHAIAPHAYLPEMLNDNDPIQRSIAVELGMRILEKCDRLVVCGNQISGGMQAEIRRAFELGIPVEHRLTSYVYCRLY